MSHYFPKKYDHEFEASLYQEWLADDAFSIPKRKRGDTQEQFVIPMPPPNVTGVLHLGHALMLAVEDAMVRHRRMLGQRVLRVPGTDHAGIATQVVVEKQLAKKKLKRLDLGREKFLHHVWDWVRSSRGTIIDQTKRMGSSCDWSREQFTLSEKLSRAVRKAFINLYTSGKITKGAYLVNRSPGAQTVVSDLEVEYKEVESKLYYIRYFIEGKGDSITIATTRPETIFADVAIAVHPKDRRYKKFIGKQVLIPIVNRPIPVIADESVAMDFGTGALKITPTHDANDFAVGQRHNLPMDRFAFDKHNFFTERAGEEFAGKELNEFYDNVIHYIKEIGNLEKIENHVHTVPFCERTGDKIQPLLSHQWFMEVAPAAQRIMQAIEEKEVTVYPDRFGKIFTGWLEQINPRCISRQLRWGHRIPVWYAEDGTMHAFDDSNVVNPKSGKWQYLARIIFNLIADGRLQTLFTIEQLIEQLSQPSLTPQEGKLFEVYIKLYQAQATTSAGQKELDNLQEIFAQIDDTPQAIIKAGEALVDMLHQTCNITRAGDKYRFDYYVGGIQTNLQQDEDVLDTWFSSALWPMSVLGWPEETPDFKELFPMTMLETGYDIIFFRVIRMMLMSVEQTNQLPFHHIYLHGLVRDEQGKKMSKSIGNVVDPMILLEKYGADALRGALLLGNTPGNDQKFTDKKVEYVWRSINKLWNATRFVAMQADGVQDHTMSYDDVYEDILKNKKKLNEYDMWMINKINDTLAQINKYLSKFMLGEALQEAVNLVWHEFCDWYIEISKLQPSAYTHKVSLYALGTFFKMLHPFLPFVSEKLRQLMHFEGKLIASSWPIDLPIGDKNYKINLLMELISQWRTLKTQATDKPHEEVVIGIQANEDIHDLIEEHKQLISDIVRVREIVYFNATSEMDNQWTVALLMDIKLGIQGIKQKDRKQELADLEKQLAEEEQFLQRMRGMLSGDFMVRAPKEVVEEKKKKMDEVKAKIAHITYEISKIKMEHK